MIGEKTTFAPHWLINACRNRGWVYATASYRLLPEAKGHEILEDAVDAVRWVNSNISNRVIIAGSSAGGYLALATAAHPDTPRPLAVLSVYGMLNPASSRYIHPGTPLVSEVDNESQALEEIEEASRVAAMLDGYPFPANPPTDQRFQWIKALHQAARYADVLTRKPGLARQIADQGTDSIPQEDRALFPATFCLSSDFPPTILLHGDADILVGVEQSVAVADALKSLGVDVSLECAEGQGHGFDAREVIDLDQNGDVGRNVAFGSLRRVIGHLEKYLG